MTAVLKAARVGARLCRITAQDGVITAVENEGAGAALPPDAVVYDAGGARVFPGLVEIHAHGCGGHDTMDGDALSAMAADFRRAGVTTWYPTTMTESTARIRAALAQTSDGRGAHIPGFHLEGPYISEKYKGAQNAAYIKAPDIGEFATFPCVGLVTVAPELPGALDFIRAATARGVRVAIGHTDCDYETACAAFDAGAVCLTHTCNAMRPFLHRAPGPIGAAIDKNAYVQVIADGRHLHRSMVTMLYRTFGRDRMILISDSMQATGLGDGTYIFGGQPVTVCGGVARTADGALAGSTTTLYGCVRQAVAMGIPEEDALYMASATPAAMMGLRAGKIAPGYAADFIAVDDGGELLNTFVM